MTSLLSSIWSVLFTKLIEWHKIQLWRHWKRNLTRAFSRLLMQKNPDPIVVCWWWFGKKLEISSRGKLVFAVWFYIPCVRSLISLIQSKNLALLTWFWGMGRGAGAIGPFQWSNSSNFNPSFWDRYLLCSFRSCSMSLYLNLYFKFCLCVAAPRPLSFTLAFYPQDSTFVLVVGREKFSIYLFLRSISWHFAWTTVCKNNSFFGRVQWVSFYISPHLLARMPL